MKFPDVFIRLALETSEPSEMTLRPMTPVRNGRIAWVAVSGPAMMKRSWPASATGDAPKTGAGGGVSNLHLE